MCVLENSYNVHIRMNNTRLRSPLLISIVCIGVLMGIFILTHATDSTVEAGTEEYWITQIKKYGGEEAYARFAKFVEDYDVAERHKYAHLFGAALYKVEGVASLSVCSEDYGFGCFHQFFGHAISDMGFSSVTSLNDACSTILQSNRIYCPHAVGHGIVAALGYERKDLDNALSVCERLVESDPINGCFNGVFMEYNIRTMLGPDAALREHKSGESVAELCDSVDDKYKQSCFYWLPEWWHDGMLAHLPDLTAYRRMGEFCDTTARSAKLLETCYRGIGLITPYNARANPADVRSFCLAASDISPRRLACLSTAVSQLHFVVGSARAEEACEGLTPKEQTHCLKYARAEAHRDFPLPLPESI